MHKNMYDVVSGSFEWDEDKNRINREKHGVSFEEATRVFQDPDLVVAVDVGHSSAGEVRLHGVGLVEGGILTVRFTKRGDKIRLIGAGFWRKGRAIYEKTNG